MTTTRTRSMGRKSARAVAPTRSATPKPKTTSSKPVGARAPRIAFPRGTRLILTQACLATTQPVPTRNDANSAQLAVGAEVLSGGQRMGSCHAVQHDAKVLWVPTANLRPAHSRAAATKKVLSVADRRTLAAHPKGALLTIKHGTETHTDSLGLKSGPSLIAGTSILSEGVTDNGRHKVRHDTTVCWVIFERLASTAISRGVTIYPLDDAPIAHQAGGSCGSGSIKGGLKVMEVQEIRWAGHSTHTVFGHAYDTKGKQILAKAPGDTRRFSLSASNSAEIAFRNKLSPKDRKRLHESTIKYASRVWHDRKVGAYGPLHGDRHANRKVIELLFPFFIEWMHSTSPLAAHKAAIDAFVERHHDTTGDRHDYVAEQLFVLFLKSNIMTGVRRLWLQWSTQTKGALSPLPSAISKAEKKLVQSFTVSVRFRGGEAFQMLNPIHIDQNLTRMTVLSRGTVPNLCRMVALRVSERVLGKTIIEAQGSQIYLKNRAKEGLTKGELNKLTENIAVVIRNSTRHLQWIGTTYKESDKSKRRKRFTKMHAALVGECSVLGAEVARLSALTNPAPAEFKRLRALIPTFVNHSLQMHQLYDESWRKRHQAQLAALDKNLWWYRVGLSGLRWVEKMSASAVIAMASMMFGPVGTAAAGALMKGGQKLAEVISAKLSGVDQFADVYGEAITFNRAVGMVTVSAAKGALEGVAASFGKRLDGLVENQVKSVIANQHVVRGAWLKSMGYLFGGEVAKSAAGLPAKFVGIAEQALQNPKAVLKKYGTFEAFFKAQSKAILKGFASDVLAAPVAAAFKAAKLQANIRNMPRVERAKIKFKPFRANFQGGAMGNPKEFIKNAYTGTEIVNWGQISLQFKTKFKEHLSNIHVTASQELIKQIASGQGDLKTVFGNVLKNTCLKIVEDTINDTAKLDTDKVRADLKKAYGTSLATRLSTVFANNLQLPPSMGGRLML